MILSYLLNLEVDFIIFNLLVRGVIEFYLVRIFISFFEVILL